MIIPGFYTCGIVLMIGFLYFYSDVNVVKSLPEVIAEADTI